MNFQPWAGGLLLGCVAGAAFAGLVLHLLWLAFSNPIEWARTVAMLLGVVAG